MAREGKPRDVVLEYVMKISLKAVKLRNGEEYIVARLGDKKRGWEARAQNTVDALALLAEEINNKPPSKARPA